MSKENNITVTKDFRRIENGYQMEAEICVIFSDFGKMEDFCNLLVEKLDSTVVVGSPQFFHTNKTMENIRIYGHDVMKCDGFQQHHRVNIHIITIW
ncbi:interleukin-1 receptor-associated kinase 1-binding protein 1 homolog isoform X2 [Narcine bancroftii]|uniref:interleukin-1 receptor-associated kinase 1-binding protein 1 homolog isoform X2 n=1 Tax=Narcine bancroftii TaxID=1343680 RepID=UPI003831BFC6